MELGAFSVSLAVKDIEASKLFYAKLGFTVFAAPAQGSWRTHDFRSRRKLYWPG